MTDSSQSDSRGLSPIIRSLRLTTDEVQFGRVLAAICQDEAVAERFTSAVIGRARGGNATARRRARRKTAHVRCVDEQRLEARVSRRSLKQRALDHGRVDLDFSGDNAWQLLVEIKLGAGFGDRQIERYANERPVAAIVRDAKIVPPLRDHPWWVGAATWSDLLEDLRALPLRSPSREEWLALLDVMERDGDFDHQPPAGLPEVIAARALRATVVFSPHRMTRIPHPGSA